MIVIGSNTSDNGPSCFTEDVSHFIELRQNRQLALLKRSAKKCTNALFILDNQYMKDIMKTSHFIRYFKTCDKNFTHYYRSVDLLILTLRTYCKYNK